MQKHIIFALAVCGGISLVVLKSGSAAEVAAIPLTPTVVAQPATDEFCATKIDDASKAELAKTDAVRKWFIATKQPTPNSVVNVHFHVIQDGERGAVNDAMLAIQIDVLNDSYSLRGISFALASTDRSDNANWFGNCDAEGPSKKMKRTLHLGTATDLNVYTCEPTKFLGRASFPWLYEKYPSEDGVILHHGILPGRE